MVGRELEDYYPEKMLRLGILFFKLRIFLVMLLRIFLSMYVKGEILGFSGLMGAGRTEIMRAIFGIDSLKSGQIIINEEETDN